MPGSVTERLGCLRVGVCVTSYSTAHPIAGRSFPDGGRDLAYVVATAVGFEAIEVERPRRRPLVLSGELTELNHTIPGVRHVAPMGVYRKVLAPLTSLTEIFLYMYHRAIFRECVRREVDHNRGEPFVPDSNKNFDLGPPCETEC
jgi:hypothetical protein